MNKLKYNLIIFAIFIFTFAFVSGCGRYVKQYSAPVVIANSPAMGQTGVASDAALSVTFSKSMNTTNMGWPDIISKLKYAADMTATATMPAGVTPEVVWSNSDSTVTITNITFVATPDHHVHIVASREAFMDVNGLFIPENTDLWNYNLQ